MPGPNKCGVSGCDKGFASKKSLRKHRRLSGHSIVQSTRRSARTGRGSGRTGADQHETGSKRSQFCDSKGGTWYTGGYKGSLSKKRSGEAKTQPQAQPQAQPPQAADADADVAAGPSPAKRLRADGWTVAARSSGNYCYTAPDGASFTSKKEAAEHGSKTSAPLMGSASERPISSFFKRPQCVLVRSETRSRDRSKAWQPTNIHEAEQENANILALARAGDSYEETKSCPEPESPSSEEEEMPCVRAGFQSMPRPGSTPTDGASTTAAHSGPGPFPNSLALCATERQRRVSKKQRQGAALYNQIQTISRKPPGEWAGRMASLLDSAAPNEKEPNYKAAVAAASLEMTTLLFKRGGGDARKTQAIQRHFTDRTTSSLIDGRQQLMATKEFQVFPPPTPPPCIVCMIPAVGRCVFLSRAQRKFTVVFVRVHFKSLLLSICTAFILLCACVVDTFSGHRRCGCAWLR